MHSVNWSPTMILYYPRTGSVTTPFGLLTFTLLSRDGSPFFFFFSFFLDASNPVAFQTRRQTEPRPIGRLAPLVFQRQRYDRIDKPIIYLWIFKHLQRPESDRFSSIFFPLSFLFSFFKFSTYVDDIAWLFLLTTREQCDSGVYSLARNRETLFKAAWNAIGHCYAIQRLVSMPVLKAAARRYRHVPPESILPAFQPGKYCRRLGRRRGRRMGRKKWRTSPIIETE